MLRKLAIFMTVLKPIFPFFPFFGIEAYKEYLAGQSVSMPRRATGIIKNGEDIPLILSIV
jgi:hypothetical protein